MVTASKLLDSIMQYEVELKGIYLILALISVLVGIFIKLKWKPKMHKWFAQWLMQQEVVVERRRSTLGFLLGLILLVVALSGSAQSNGGSLILLLPALYLMFHKKISIRTQPKPLATITPTGYPVQQVAMAYPLGNQPLSSEPANARPYQPRR